MTIHIILKNRRNPNVKAKFEDIKDIKIDERQEFVVMYREKTNVTIYFPINNIEEVRTYLL